MQNKGTEHESQPNISQYIVSHSVIVSIYAHFTLDLVSSNSTPTHLV